MSLILASLAIALLQPSAPDTALRVQLERVLSEERLVGAAWATIDADGAVHTDAAGYRDNDARVPFTAATRFHVGSVAKAVLATGILRLVTEGRIGLDDPVRRILPALAIENPWESTHPVRVRHLLDHTSGLDDMRLRQMFSSRVAADAPLASAFRDGDLRVRVPPGSRLSYSNTGYTVLGMIIETVTGVRYEDYLDAQLLAPLGMRNSTFRFTTQEGPAADTSLAWGHLDAGQSHAALAVALRPAAQMTTTAYDLALFARFLMGDGRVDGKPFVRADLMLGRGKPVGTEAAKAGLDAGYALGLARRDRYGAIGYCHSGNTVGFLANVCVYPEARKAFVIAVNTDSESARYERLFEKLAAHLRVEAPPTAPAAAPAADIGDWEGYFVASPSRFQTFAYLDAVIDVVRLRRAGDSLLFSRGFGAQRTLRPMGGYLFAAPDRRGASHVLIRAGDERSVSDGISTYLKVGALRVIALRASLVLGVLGTRRQLPASSRDGTEAFPRRRARHTTAARRWPRSHAPRGSRILLEYALTATARRPSPAEGAR